MTPDALIARLQAIRSLMIVPAPWPDGVRLQAVGNGLARLVDDLEAESRPPIPGSPSFPKPLPRTESTP